MRLTFDGGTENFGWRAMFIESARSLERENIALRKAMQEYFDALEATRDQTIIGSTCRLIRAESGVLNLLDDRNASPLKEQT